MRIDLIVVILIGLYLGEWVEPSTAPAQYYWTALRFLTVAYYLAHRYGIESLVGRVRIARRGAGGRLRTPAGQHLGGAH